MDERVAQYLHLCSFLFSTIVTLLFIPFFSSPQPQVHCGFEESESVEILWTPLKRGLPQLYDRLRRVHLHQPQLHRLIIDFIAELEAGRESDALWDKTRSF